MNNKQIISEINAGIENLKVSMALLSFLNVFGLLNKKISRINNNIEQLLYLSDFLKINDPEPSKLNYIHDKAVFLINNY